MRRLSRLLTRRNGVLKAAVAPAVESLESRQLLSMSLDLGVLSVSGTAGRDRITFSLKSGDSSKLVATCNSQRAEYAVSAITQIQASGLQGADYISAVGLSIPVLFYGGAGNDSLVGGNGNDTLWGGGGNDLLMGSGGSNVLRGEAGDDRILGGAGNDTISGGGGHDIINGGGSSDIIHTTNTADVNGGAGGVAEPLYQLASPTASPLVGFQFGAVGLVPTQIRTAYGFGDLSDANFQTRGRGQTIYVVDAFTGVDVMGDLNVFSAQFGLPLVNASTFQFVNANSTGFAPAVDAEWAGEIALDVQWVHAIAPKAKIVLVQADTAFPDDLLRAVQTAANLSESNGGGVVSMSFKLASEDDPFRPLYEAVFSSSPRTTFVAAAGDTPGVSYPATSPNVLSVGGTTLFVDASGNRIAPESGWDMSGGGESAVFPHPAYQSPLGLPGAVFNRLTPDVGYNADPESGVAVYNSTPMGDISGWAPGGVGGTSAGTPQWAALIALANGVRARSLKPTIGTSANANIYQIAQANYAATFNDITTGGFPGDPLPTPPLPPQLAGVGFDLCTGWGTPKATAVINDLSNNTVAFLATNVSYTATMILPSTAVNTNPNTQTTILTVPMGGTGLAAGGSRINLVFVPKPNIWDTTGVAAQITATDLYSTVPIQNPAPGSYRVYGSGNVNFFDYTLTGLDAVGNAVIVPLSRQLRFEGWITVAANGQESINCDFWIVDRLGNAVTTSPFQLANLNTNPPTSQIEIVGFTGSFSG